MTRDQAEATVRFFGFMRNVIVAAPQFGTTTVALPSRVTPEDSKRWELGEFSDAEKVDVIVRALRTIALDPAGRADTLLSLDVHIAYLRGSFELPGPARWWDSS